MGVPAYLYPRNNEEGDRIAKMPEQALLKAKAAASRPVLVNLPVAIIVFGAWTMTAKRCGAAVPSNIWTRVIRSSAIWD